MPINKEAYVTLAGDPSDWERDFLASVRPGQYSGTFNSNDCCAVEARHHARGFRAIHLVKSVYGWGLRHANGLDAFGIFASSRTNPHHPGVLDGTREDAIRFGRAWANNNPKMRELYAYRDDVKDLLTADGRLCPL